MSVWLVYISVPFIQIKLFTLDAYSYKLEGRAFSIRNMEIKLVISICVTLFLITCLKRHIFKIDILVNRYETNSVLKTLKTTQNKKNAYGGVKMFFI